MKFQKQRRVQACACNTTEPAAGPLGPRGTGSGKRSFWLGERERAKKALIVHVSNGFVAPLCVRLHLKEEHNSQYGPYLIASSHACSCRHAHLQDFRDISVRPRCFPRRSFPNCQRHVKKQLHMARKMSAPPLPVFFFQLNFPRSRW